MELHQRRSRRLFRAGGTIDSGCVGGILLVDSEFLNLVIATFFSAFCALKNVAILRLQKKPVPTNIMNAKCLKLLLKSLVPMVIIFSPYLAALVFGLWSSYDWDKRVQNGRLVLVESISESGGDSVYVDYDNRTLEIYNLGHSTVSRDGSGQLHRCIRTPSRFGLLTLEVKTSSGDRNNYERFFR